MGLFYVGCRVLNPATSKSSVVRRLMVDTGAESTWIDAAVLEAIGIEPRKKDLQFQLANGQIVTRSVGYAVLRIDKAETVDEVVFAQRGDLQLLGARAGRTEPASGFTPEKTGGCRSDRQCRRRASAIRTVGAGPSGSSKEPGKAPGEQAEEASGYQIQSTMNGADAPENRVRVLRRALMYFGDVGLPGAEFRFIWPSNARLAEVPAIGQSGLF